MLSDMLPSMNNEKKGVHAKVYWPEHYTTSPSGYLVGWNSTSFVNCVATVVTGVELTDLERVLKEIEGQWGALSTQYPALTHCDPPVILGIWIALSKVITPIYSLCSYCVGRGYCALRGNI